MCVCVCVCVCEYDFTWRCVRKRGVVGIATGLLAGGSGARIPIGSRDILSFKACIPAWKPIMPPVQWVQRLFCKNKAARGVNSARYLVLMSRRRMNRAISPFPIHLHGVDKDIFTFISVVGQTVMKQ